VSVTLSPLVPPYTHLELVVGFAETSYTVFEGDGVATVSVVITQGSVGMGETVSLNFSTTDDTAIGMYM